MTLLRKTIYGLIVITGSLGFGTVFAQADQADERAAEAAANAQSGAESDNRAVREGDTITTNKAVITKQDGEPASVQTPAETGRVETPNRGVAAGARNAAGLENSARAQRPETADSGSSPRGRGR